MSKGRRDHPPPWSEDAERAVLGGCLHNPDNLDALDLDAGAFWSTEHRRVWEALGAIRAAGEPVDLPTVAARLKGKVEAATVAGLTTQADGTPDVVTHHARTVRRLAGRRAALGVAETAAQRLREDPDADPAKLLSDVHGALSRIDTGGPAVRGIGAADLMALDLPAPSFVVADILPEGLSLLVGPPKLGKSFFALALGAAVAHGGPALGGIRTEPGRVLVVALEDSRRRVQNRLRMLLEGTPPPDELTIVTLEDRWPRPLPEGLTDLARYVRDHKPRLIVLDTLGRLRRAGNGKRNAYGVDVDELGPLQALAQGTPGLAVLALHHTRKGTSADYLENASGTFGVAGTADAILTIARTRAPCSRGLW